MAEVKPSSSRGEDSTDLVGEEDACSGADRGSTSVESVPPSIAAAARPPSFLTWMIIQIVTACSGVVWGARGGGVSGSRMCTQASGAQQHSLEEDSESEVLSRIAASKSTWSEVPGRHTHHSISSVPCPSQLSVWEELKESTFFFYDFWVERLALGRLIAEGGQAQIYEAKLEGLDFDCVLKVFKLDPGFSLADLKRHWPRTMKKDGDSDCRESLSGQERSSRFVFDDFRSNFDGDRCWILGATLLKDGRFSFLMRKYWGDLRRLIDLKVEVNTHPWEFDFLLQPLFSFHDSICIMLQIARGMKILHGEGVLHRDLKAANVLIRHLTDDSVLYCNVADYECAMFVQGTGFWRAPEVLQELLRNKEDRNGEIWTQKVDVYSFGMTCYEILTGQKPFDGYMKSKWGNVIGGERPFLPNYVSLELRELVEACWHAQPF